jgi:hypothetical protein
VNPPLDQQLARTIFFGLVLAQDRGLPVRASREAVAAEWRVTVEQVREVERAGIDGAWPPLT